jgi:hypothetical protein
VLWKLSVIYSTTGYNSRQVREAAERKNK